MWGIDQTRNRQVPITRKKYRDQKREARRTPNLIERFVGFLGGQDYKHDDITGLDKDG